MTKPALIWIVDDSATQRAITERSLGTSHRYEQFADGTSFIERLSHETRLPDVVLLDWVMPGLSGDEVCRFVRASSKSRDIPIVILTASRTDTQDIVCALESGANDYVSKPFVPSELRARLKTILAASELRQAAERERRRITTVNGLARALFAAGTDIEKMLGALASAIVKTLCDGCAIEFRHGTSPVMAAHRHRSEHGAGLLAGLTGTKTRTFATPDEALAAVPAAFVPYVQLFGLRAVIALPLPVRGFADGVVTLTRDGPSEPFDDDDLAALETCVDLTGIAIEAGLRAEADRVSTKFHQELIAIVSHDLRTPLGAMMMGADLLRSAVAHDAPSAQILGRIENSARRMTGIVTQLLDLTRSQIGEGILLEPRPTSLTTVVNGVLDEQRLVYGGSTFTVTGDDIHGTWDPDRLAQVVANLTSNAVHYGLAHSVVAVTLSRESDTAVLAVHNELRGEPIAAAKLRSAFDPFKRGDTGGHAKGLGLGLYIVSEIVRAHGGAISATSGGHGTEFRVVLPLVAPPPPPQPAAG